jgi:hypothetical protein
MRRLRFHIGTLIVLVLVLGVSFAALRESNETWDSGVFTLTLVILLTSVLLAIHRTESRRAFWVGFALFGWTYLGLSLVPSIESRLATTMALTYIDSKVPRSMSRADALYDLLVVNDWQSNVLYVNKGNGTFQDVTATVGLDFAGNQGTSNGTFYLNNSAGLWLRGSSGTPENFMRIGHSLFALTLAFVGGQLSRCFHSRSLRRAPEPGSPTTGHQPTEPLL